MANVSKIASVMVDGRMVVEAVASGGQVTLTFNDGTSLTFAATPISGGSKTVQNIAVSGGNLVVTYTDGTSSTLSGIAGGGSGTVGPTGPTGPTGPQGAQGPSGVAAIAAGGVGSITFTVSSNTGVATAPSLPGTWMLCVTDLNRTVTDGSYALANIYQRIA